MIKKDPIEETSEYKSAMEKIDSILDEEFPQDAWHIGMCHQYWYRKKELLKRNKINWRSPGEMNPNVRFD